MDIEIVELCIHQKPNDIPVGYIAIRFGKKVFNGEFSVPRGVQTIQHLKEYNQETFYWLLDKCIGDIFRPFVFEALKKWENKNENKYE